MESSYACLSDSGRYVIRCSMAITGSQSYRNANGTSKHVHHARLARLDMPDPPKRDTFSACEFQTYVCYFLLRSASCTALGWRVSASLFRRMWLQCRPFLRRLGVSEVMPRLLLYLTLCTPSARGPRDQVRGARRPGPNITTVHEELV